ncbi:MAG: acyl carrier protein [Tenacibaculum sp.]
MNTTTQLYNVVAKALDIPTEIINDQLAYQGVAEWDSMSHLILVQELESTYKISISMEDVLEMNNVLKIKDILKKNGVKIV